MAEFNYKNLTQEEQDKIDAAVFRRLLAHLDDNKDVQNIDLMILAGLSAVTVSANGMSRKQKRWGWS